MTQARLFPHRPTRRPRQIVRDRLEGFELRQRARAERRARVQAKAGKRVRVVQETLFDHP